MIKYKIRFFLYRAVKKIMYLGIKLFSSETSYDSIHRGILNLMAIFKSTYFFKNDYFEVKYLINSDIGFFLFFKGYFEDSELNICKQLLKEDDVIIDIGANIGIHSLFFSKVSYKGFIYSFEPSRTTFSLLSQNLKNTSNVLPVNFGVGKKNEILEFYEASDNAFSSFKDTKRKPIIYSSKVFCINLDDYADLLNINKIDFIKIDVEGFEHDVILGLPNIMKTFKPIIFCEIYKGENSNLHPEDTIRLICDFNYKAYVISGDKLISYISHSDFFQNYVFLPNDALIEVNNKLK